MDDKLLNKFYQLSFPETLKNEVQDVKKAIELYYSGLYKIVFCGVFNSGKSSLINSILGEDILPVSVLSKTGVITNIYYSEQRTAYVKYRNGRGDILSFEKAVSMISIIKKSLDGINANEVDEIGLGINHPLLKNNTIFIDTPGLCDSAKMTAKAEKIIKESDMVVFIINATSFISSYEKDFVLYLTNEYGLDITHAVNKCDELKQKEDIEDIQSVASALIKDNGKIFYTSSLLKSEFENKQLVENIFHSENVKQPKIRKRRVQMVIKALFVKCFFLEDENEPDINEMIQKIHLKYKSK